MRTYILSFSAAFILCLSLSNCNLGCLPGEGEIVEKEIDLDLFNGFVAEGSIDVELSYGPNQKVSVQGHENHIELLETEVDSKVWSIEFSENVCSDDLKVFVQLPELESIHMRGSGDVIGSTPIQARELSIEMEGSGDLELSLSAETIELEMMGSGTASLSGSTEEIEIELSGSGEAHAYDLKADNVEAAVNGSGDIEVTAKRSIDAEVNGSGSIYYKGDPKEVSVKKSGSGDILPK